MIENIYECPICGMMWHSSKHDNCPVEDCEVVGNIVGEYKLPAETILPTLDDLLEAQKKEN